MVAYATLLSEEALASDELRRRSESDSASSRTVTPDAGPIASPPALETQEQLDADLAKAITLSLSLDHGAASGLAERGYDVPINHARSRRSPSGSPSGSRLGSGVGSSGLGIGGGHARAVQLDDEGDLEFALRLSLAEERSRGDAGGIDSGKLR